MYIVKWIVDKRIALTQPVGDQTPETIGDSVERLESLMDAGNAPIHVISDVRYLGKFPTNLALLRKMMKAHDKSGHTVIVGGGGISNFFASTLTQLSGGNRPKFKDNLADAIAWLQRFDRTLPREIEVDDSPPQV